MKCRISSWLGTGQTHRVWMQVENRKPILSIPAFHGLLVHRFMHVDMHNNGAFVKPAFAAPTWASPVAGIVVVEHEPVVAGGVDLSSAVSSAGLS